nr:uncharacterized protein LOC109403469 isoform X2 [Aedes albopictus]XP_029723540.1 uncharacterized protein LOC109403469 isoform X2 [Aedes albopictus]
MQTFLALNERDFSRMSLTTKMIKIIEKLQTESRTEADDTLYEEFIEEEADATDENSQIEAVIDPNNPYQGISLEQVIHIDRIFERTVEGAAILELLREGTRVTETDFKRINNLICDCLKSLFGCRPTNFHKNQLAVSLVKSYPILGASSTETPQALWFHAHARGTNRHAGRIHYRMEYLARQSGERVIKRRRIESSAPSENVPLVVEPCSADIQTLIEELKFIVPNQANRSRVIELWAATFGDRQTFRNENRLSEYFQDFPVFSAYNGELVSIDYAKMKPSAAPFIEIWEQMEPKVLKQHEHLYKEIRADFIRALSIIRLKNPSRGSKRKQDSTARKLNPLSGIIEWIKVEDDLPMTESVAPVLFVRGEPMQASRDCVLRWNQWIIPVAQDVKTAFKLLVESFTVLKVSPAPTDKQFFLFMNGAVCQTETLNTTGAKFLHSLD